MRTTAAPVVHQLPEHQSWQLLRTAAVGRLAVVVDGEPDIFPVNHVVDHGSLVFRTAEGTKLWAAVGSVVAYEVDGVDLGTGEAWSVVLRGRAHEVRQLHDLVDALLLPVHPWQGGSKPCVVRVDGDHVSGRRFVATTAALTGG